jgi:7,8-dihydropterin-6-yl-methyl-4-(beta-D-ribofuranosyl)aminobenzene 5'-phosphate synthase
MEVKITTLSENSATGGCLGEWGLSMLVEVDGKKILFDTGAGVAAVQNAQIMGVDLAEIDAIVLSHGHHDHTGGLRDVLRRAAKPLDVIAHPDVWGLKYGRAPTDKTEHFAGLPFRRELLESLGAKFNLARKPVRIANGITTTGEIPMVTGYEAIDKGLLEKKGDEMLPDKLADDLALVIEADFGLVVILGCAHRGIVNTLRRARKVTGKELIYAAIGGTHLVHASPERLERTAADLEEMGVQYLGVSHCTGFKASAYLAERFGERFFLNNSGTKLELPFK